MQINNNYLNGLNWTGDISKLITGQDEINSALKEKDISGYLIEHNNEDALAIEGALSLEKTDHPIKAILPHITSKGLGDIQFRERFNVEFSYMTGSMANGIASKELVLAMAENGFLASFGAAGLSPDQIKISICELKERLKGKSFCCNLIHTPQDDAYEQTVVDLYLEHDITIIEASAFMQLSLPLIEYRVKGLTKDSLDRISIKNKIIAKISNPSIAKLFMQPIPINFLDNLLAQNKISDLQHELAKYLPLADAITVEADSGGHTDQQSLTCLLPTITNIRNKIQLDNNYEFKMLVGAAGGIGTPQAIYAAFSMGADYVVTGSINQACIEAGTSTAVKQLLSKAGTNDTTLAPAPDMFELGVMVQVLKRGSLFPMRARKLYAIFNTYESIDEIPKNIIHELEEKIFNQSINSVWENIKNYLMNISPEYYQHVITTPKKKIAYLCKWYMNHSSKWAVNGINERAGDYQIWCGPAMSAFNEWAAYNEFSNVERRSVVNVAQRLLDEACFHARQHHLSCQLSINTPPCENNRITNMNKNDVNEFEIRDFLINQISAEVSMPASDIDIRQPLSEYNITSVRSMLILSRLEKKLELKLSPILLWSYPTIESLSTYVAQLFMDELIN